MDDQPAQMSQDPDKEQFDQSAPQKNISLPLQDQTMQWQTKVIQQSNTFGSQQQFGHQSQQSPQNRDHKAMQIQTQHIPGHSPADEDQVNKLQTPWRHFRDMAWFSLLSGGWKWVLVFSICSPSTPPTFQLRLKTAIMVECALQLMMAIFNLAPSILNRLRRRPQGRQGGHDTPRLELSRLRREPSQFEDDTSSPPTHLN